MCTYLCAMFLTTIYHYTKDAVVFDFVHAVGFGVGVNCGVNAWLRILIGLLQRYKHRLRANYLALFIQVVGPHPTAKNPVNSQTDSVLPV